MRWPDPVAGQPAGAARSATAASESLLEAMPTAVTAPEPIPEPNPNHVLDRVEPDPAPAPVRLPLPLFAHPVHAGFPSPADDYVSESLDLNEHLVAHKEATFFLRARRLPVIE